VTRPLAEFSSFSDTI